MIRVTQPVAPPDYEAKVRDRGYAFLRRHPNPSGNDWRNRNYWGVMKHYLYDELHGVCVYSSSFTPRRPSDNPLDHTTIDHFVPKTVPPHFQAYDWDNFRFCRSRLNHRKGDFRDVLDPCAIQTGWFRLNFTTFALGPDPGLSDHLKQRIRDTIERLALNFDDAFVNERARTVYGYADGRLRLDDVSRRYPFIAAEMTAQQFDVRHLPKFKTALGNPRLRAALTRQGWL